MTDNEKYHGAYAVEFHYRTEDGMPLISFLEARPETQDAMLEIMRSAAQGNCVKDCGPCGGSIKSDAALVGVALFHGSDDRTKTELNILSPICAKCYAIGRDILETRFIYLIKERVFKGDAEIMFSPNTTRN
jgi:hypothetical protein